MGALGLLRLGLWGFCSHPKPRSTARPEPHAVGRGACAARPATPGTTSRSQPTGLLPQMSKPRLREPGSLSRSHSQQVARQAALLVTTPASRPQAPHTGSPQLRETPSPGG